MNMLSYCSHEFYTSDELIFARNILWGHGNTSLLARIISRWDTPGLFRFDSFKGEIKLSDVNTLLGAEFWPVGVHVRSLQLI